MAKQTINIGSAANDGTGSTLRAAFDITNDNFTELYDGSGGLLHKIEGTNFTGSLLVGHSTTGTISSAEYNTGIGISALDALTEGDYNVALGFEAATALTAGSFNVILGSRAGKALTTGVHNVAIGYAALRTEDTGDKNVAVGYAALNALNYDGDGYNVAVGHSAGLSVTTGVRNTLIGAEAGDALTTGIYNVAVGYAALSTEDDSGFNTAIGYGALRSQNASGTGNNVAVGKDAGVNITTGINNTIIGALAGDALQTGSNNILIGKNAAASAVDVSNEVTIGDSNIANVRIPADSTLKIGASGDLQLEHLSSNSFIKNTAVGDLYIENQVDDKDIIFRSDDGSGGVTTYFKCKGDETVTQFVQNTNHQDNAKATFGTGLDLEIYHDTSNSYVTAKGTGDLIIQNTTDDKDIIFQSDDGSGGTTAYLTLDGSLAQMWADKDLQFSDNIKAKFGASSDLQIYHDGSNSNYITSTTSDIYLRNEGDDDRIFIQATNSSTVANYLTIDGNAQRNIFSKSLRLLDDVQLDIGSSDDFRIKHTSANNATFIQNFTGNLNIEQYADDSDIIFKSDDGSGGTAEYFRLDGSLVNGSSVLGATRFPDKSKIYMGAGGDLEIFHDGTDTYLENYTGNFIFTQALDNGDIILKSDDGSGGTTAYLTLDGSAEKILMHKSTVFSGGGMDYGVDGTGADVIFYGDTSGRDMKWDQSEDHLLFKDNTKLKLGTGGDLEIYHDASNSYIQDTGTGNLLITSDGASVQINKGTTENMAEFITDGAVKLYYDSARKFETTSTGVNIQGVPEHADNSAASSAGLAVGDVYRTGDLLKIRH